MPELPGASAEEIAEALLAGARRPGVRFERAAWQAERELQDAEYFYRNRFRDQVPPWVILADAEDDIDRPS